MVDTGLAAKLRGPGGRPLRVAHLTTVDMSLALLLAAELEVDIDSGFEVFGISAPGPYVPDVERLGVTHVPVASLSRSWKPAHDLRAAYELADVLRSLQLDVLHAHTPKAGVLGRLVGRLTRVPVVVNTCHGLWLRPTSSRVARTAVLGIEGLAAGVSHAELYQSSEDADSLRWAVAARRSRVVGNGIDLVRFGPNAELRYPFRMALGVGDDDLLVGAVGRQVAEKGAKEYAEMAAKLAGKARFVWVGPPDEDKPDTIREWPASVEVLGARADMAAVYAALDVFVLPSYREGFSRSAMEAAACGLPMVLTDIRGCREIGVHGEHLLLVPPGDTLSLTHAVEALLDRPDVRALLGDAARRHALATFDQRAIARMSIDTYYAVARRRRLGWTLGRAVHATVEV